MFAGVLPISIHNNSIYLLLGREIYVEGWDDSNKWSEFGGKMESHDIIYEAARELYEESMGIFGTIQDTVSNLVPIDIPHAMGYFLLWVEYDPLLPTYYNNIYKYLTACTQQCPEGYMEKSEIQWFSLDELKHSITNQSEIFRPYFIKTFYHILKYIGEGK